MCTASILWAAVYVSHCSRNAGKSEPMRKTALALTLISALLISVLTGTLLIQNGAITFGAQGQSFNSNTIVNGSPVANITIQSPENMTYNVNNVTLAFTIECDVLPLENFSGSVNYQFFMHGVVLDYNPSNLVNLILARATNGETVGEIPDNVSTSLSSLGNNLYAGNTALTDLSQGAHNVTVWVSVYQYIISDFLGTTYPNYEGAVLSTVSFNIDSIPPHITILSPETEVYNTSDVPLDFTVNKAVSQISYSLDGHQNITTTGNMTLTGLSNGAHNVTVYATDEAGNVGTSQTINFTIAKSEPFPTALVTAVSGASVVIVIVVGLLVHFKKRKPKTHRIIEGQTT